MTINKLKIKVLQVGAHEQLMFGYYKNFRRKSIVFDYILRDGGKDFSYKNDRFFDGNLYYITPLQVSYARWMLELRGVVSKNNYDIVHLHLGWANILGLIACLGLRTRVVSHNHSSYGASTAFKKFLRIPIKLAINLLTWERLGCSKVAARQMFYGKALVLKNAIDYDRFIFKQSVRDAVRNALKINDSALVFAHAGTFSASKNHLFLIRLFEKIRSEFPNSILLLAGDDYGTLAEVNDLISNLDLRDSVINLGQRSDIEDLFCAADVFLLPSIFEGLPLVQIEAQASGLPIVYSSTITTEAEISNFCYRCSISEESLEEWIVAIRKSVALGLESEARLKRCLSINQDYNVKEVAHILEGIYLKVRDKMVRELL